MPLMQRQQPQMAPPAPEPAPGAMPAETPNGGAEAVGQEPFSAEEEKHYNNGAEALGTVLYKKAENVIGLLGGEKPIESAAGFLANLVYEIDQRTGGKLEEATVIPIATKGIEIMADIGAEAGVIEDEQAFATQMTSVVYSLLFDMYDVDPESIDGLA